MSEKVYERIHDDGRLVARRLPSNAWIGLRLPSWQTLRGKTLKHIVSQHNLLESHERIIASGIRGEWGKKPYDDKKARARQVDLVMAREWLTRRWA